MHAFKRIIEAYRKDPKIVSSVDESLNCLIKDINAREAFTMKYNIGGQSHAARIKVSANSKSTEEEASNSTKLPKQPDEKIELSRGHSTNKGTSETILPLARHPEII